MKKLFLLMLLVSGFTFSKELVDWEVVSTMEDGESYAIGRNRISTIGSIKSFTVGINLAKPERYKNKSYTVINSKWEINCKTNMIREGGERYYHNNKQVGIFNEWRDWNKIDEDGSIASHFRNYVCD